MDPTNPNVRIALFVVGGLIVGMVLTLILLLFTAGVGQNAAVTDTTGLTTATITPTTTTTTPPTTTAAPTTTATTSPTTTGAPVESSTLDTSTKAAESTGQPGSALTDVRTGDHDTFSRIVFDFEGNGTPAYEVGYQSGPSFVGSGGGDPVAPDGSAFLVIRIIPGLTYDVDDYTPTYLGPVSFDPGLGSIAEIAFVGDFEADMIWVVGLTGERGFEVTTRTDPQRLVVDIAS